MIQLREKDMSQEEFLKEAREMTALCHSYGTALIINDNVEVALKSGADGVHVGIEDTPVKEIRKRFPGILSSELRQKQQNRHREQSRKEPIILEWERCFLLLPKKMPFVLRWSS